MKKIRLGIIGLGVFFRKMHIPVLTAAKDKFAVEGVFTSDTRKFRDVKNCFPSARKFSTIDALLADRSIDAVVACVPIPEHGRIAHKVIKARKPLLLEKPMAADLKQAAKIVALVRAERVPVMVAESFRYFQHFRDLKAVLDRRVLGKIEFVQVQAIKKFDKDNPYYATGWRVRPQGYPGILWDAGVHAVSLLRFLFGDFSVRHKILTSHNKLIGRHDTVSADLEFAEKLGCSFLMSYALFGREEYFLTVYCQRGRIKCGMNSFLVESNAKTKEYRSSESVYPKIYSDFYRLVQGKQKPFYTLHDAYEDLKALDSLVKK